MWVLKGLILLYSFRFLFGRETQAIIGGENEGTFSCYAAQLPGTGDLNAVSHLPLGVIHSVAINNSSLSIIVGNDEGAGLPFAAFVSSSGDLSPISEISPGVNLTKVALNDFGVAVLGGRDFSAAYSAIVSAQGAVFPILGLPSLGTIDDVGIQNQGISLVGGRDLSSGEAIAFFVLSPENILPIAALPSSGAIESVAINHASQIVLGGGAADTGAAFALVGDIYGKATPLQGLPSFGFITSVAINDSALAVIGGRDFTSLAPFVAFVSPDAEVSPVAGLPEVGQIQSVAINDAGLAIVGGENSSDGSAYSALIFPKTGLLAIEGLPDFGQIESVAISNKDIAIIGGFGSDKAFSALVSPSGSLLYLPLLPEQGLIESLAILEELAPKSFGPRNSFLNGAFLLSTEVLASHFRPKNPFRGKKMREAEVSCFIADGSDAVSKEEKKLEPQTALWMSLFGNGSFQKKDHDIPEFSSWLGGGFIGFDYSLSPFVSLGIGGAYSYSFVDGTQSDFKTTLSQEFAAVYGSWSQKYFCLNASLLAGFSQGKNTRYGFLNTSSASRISSWLFSPHIEMNFPISVSSSWFFLSPFLMADWANCWQDAISEKGQAGFNLDLKAVYTSLLRTELGLLFFQDIRCTLGTFQFEEKGSWVYKTPFGSSSSQAVFIGGISTFPIEIFNSRTQNLAAFELGLTFFPRSLKKFYGSLNYQGEWSPFFQSHSLYLEFRF